MTTPTLSIVVLADGGAGLLKGTVFGLMHMREALPAHEIMIVNRNRDRSSAELVATMGQVMPWLRASAAPEGISVQAAIARAVANTSGPNLLIFHDDLIGVSNWVAPLLTVLEDESVGIAGPRLMGTDGTAHDAGLGYDGGLVVRIQAEPSNTESRDVPAVSGACLAMRRKLYEEVGGPSLFLSAIHAGVDLCLRVRRSGRKSVWCPQSSLIHFESGAADRSDRDPDDFRTAWEIYLESESVGDRRFWTKGRPLSQVTCP